jgi:tetratricopeptide (TPR) repeat protein
MDADDSLARLMLYLIDWLFEDKAANPNRRILLDLDWRSSAEFQGYLAQVLEQLVDEETALQSWYNFSEKSWLNFIVGLLHSRRGDWAGAENRMREAILAADQESWEYYLAQAQLEQFQKRRRDAFNTEAQWKHYQAALRDFETIAAKAQSAKLERREKLVALYSKIADGTTVLKQKLEIMEQTHAVLPDNRSILAATAYYSAADGDWPKSLGYIRKFLQTGVRQNARRMSMELLEACVLTQQGEVATAQKILQNYQSRIRTPWFLDINDYLLGKKTEKSLKEMAGESPEKLLTAYTFMGFWNEASGKPEKAVKHYREALESLLDDWLEYDFARERIEKIKTSSPDAG